MGLVNKRLFGTPITGSVSASLASRQSVSGDIDFGETVKIPNITDKSSRTPFVRMWTSIKVLDPAVLAESLESLQEFEVLQGKKSLNKEELLKKANKVLQDKFKTDYPNACVIQIKNNKKEVIKYAIKPNSDTPQVDYLRKIYEVGNHTYQTRYETVDENNVMFGTDLTDLQKTTADATAPLFPQELKTNPLMKPQAGITGIASETQGSLGVIKKTTISFVVNNFYDYDNVYNKFFLKPGATIFVDFGWSSIDELYRPEELINSSNIQEFLYNSGDNGKSMGQVAKYQGDLEVIQGIVTDYNSKILKNGSVECSVTLTSANAAMLSFKTDTEVVTRIKTMLHSGILYLGLRNIVGSKVNGEFVDDDDRDLYELMSTPDFSNSAKDNQTFSKNLLLSAKVQLSGNDRPEDNAIRNGVYVTPGSNDDIYMAWGLFEDLIINRQFGIGKDFEDINKGKRTQVRINSSNSFTSWNSITDERQQVLSSTHESAGTFVYPEWWGGQDIGRPNQQSNFDTNFVGKGSFSFQQEKYPIEFYNEDELKNLKTIMGTRTLPYTRYDKMVNGPITKVTAGRIPIREVFVNIKTIITAFEVNDDLEQVLSEILDEINKDSSNLFDWKLFTGDTDNEFMVIDQNYGQMESYTNKFAGNPRLFTFNIMSKNSMVKDYNLDFKIPTGDIGNMYAIQGMSHGNSLFSLSKDVQNTAAAQSIDNDSLSILYEPDYGTFRLDQMLSKNTDAEAYNVYNQIDKFLGTGEGYNFSVASFEPPNVFNTALTGSNASQFGVKEVAVTPESIIKKNNDELIINGFKVANTVSEYYDMKINKEIVMQKVPNLLPYNLSLTIYGFSSILPGDTFKVDYLPKMYLDNTYVQTMKVIHDIGPGGWYTTLDTQFKLNPEQREIIENQMPRDDIRISPSFLLNAGLTTKLRVETGTFLGSFWLDDDFIGIKHFAPMMSNCTIYKPSFSNLDYVIEFTTAKQLHKFVGPKGGEIKHNSRTRPRGVICQFGSAKGSTGVSLGHKHSIFSLLNQSNFKDINPLPFSNAFNTRHYEFNDFLFVEQNKIRSATFYRVSAGIIYLKPEQEYSIIISGNDFSILDRGNTGIYKKQLDFFSRFAGMVTPEFADQYDDLKAKLF